MGLCALLVSVFALVFGCAASVATADEGVNEKVGALLL